MGHLLGQLVRLVALRERNRVTAGGGGGTGGEGGKHLEEGRKREERRGKEERRGSVRDLSQRKGKSYGWDEASWAMEVRGTDVMKATSRKQKNQNQREAHQQPVNNTTKTNIIIPTMGDWLRLNYLNDQKMQPPHKMERVTFGKNKKERKNKQKTWLKHLWFNLHHPVPKQNLTRD